MSFWDAPFTPATPGTSTPPTQTAEQPSPTLNDEVTEVIGQLERFWGGFRKQVRPSTTSRPHHANHFLCAPKGSECYPGGAEGLGGLRLTGAERHQPAAHRSHRLHSCASYRRRCAVADRLVINTRSNRLYHHRRRELGVLVDFCIHRDAPRPSTATAAARTITISDPEPPHTPPIFDPPRLAHHPPRHHPGPCAGPTGAHGPRARSTGTRTGRCCARRRTPARRERVSPRCGTRRPTGPGCCLDLSGAARTRRPLQVRSRRHRLHPCDAPWRPAPCVALESGHPARRPCRRGALGCAVC